MAIAALAVALPEQAQARAGQLDSKFSKDGKVVVALPAEETTGEYAQYALPFEFAAGRVVMASAGKGKTVVANSKVIVTYLTDGSRNRNFGGGGAVPIGEIEGSRFQLADIAVDSEGRVLVAGTTKPKTRLGMIGPPVPGPIPSVVTIRRYLADGRLDQSFGSEGVLSTDLGIDPPTFEGQSYPEAAVSVIGLLVDGLSRPILTGSAVFEVGRCENSQSRYEASRGFIARLTPSGGPDPTFAAQNGVKAVGGVAWIGSPSFGSSGVVSIGASVDPCSRGEAETPSMLASFGADGSLNGGFHTDGFWSRPFTRITSLAVAPSGKLVLLVRTLELFRGRWVESSGEVIRLRADGSLDTGFGRAGRADLGLPKRGSISAVGVDAKDRVLLVGQVWSKQLRKPKRFPQRSSLLVMRMTKTGKLDSSFGNRGRVATRFGGKTKVRGTEVMASGGGILASGKIVGPKIANGLAIARYRNGR